VTADTAGVGRRGLRRGAALLLAVSAGLPLACGSSSTQGTNGREIRDVDPTAIPATVVDLNVVHENIRSTIVKGVDTYLAATGLVSLRKDNVVQATLQISDFTSAADDSSLKFRQSLVAQVGGSAPTLVRVGSDSVYVTSATKQRVYIWFRPRRFFVLLVRNDYGTPRSLLRALLGLPL
jgi:hypothetical protein